MKVLSWIGSLGCCFGRMGLMAFAMAAATCSTTRAEDYPMRWVRIVVPTGPGGGYDVVGRIIGDQLGRRRGQAVVIENRTGPGTIVGTQSVISSQPDGYTLLVGGLSNIVFNTGICEKAPYDALTQLVPVAIVYKNAYIVVASKKLPHANIKELIAAAKSKPSSLNLATAGVGTSQLQTY
jgi:tripartite-type tricarboxylate transporter receptor subunit TctC